jgi:two-component system, OmpR family, response regulator TctD
MSITMNAATSLKCRTLIVEDDRDSCDALATMVRRLGHDVECVETAGAALVKLEEWQPHCVLLDLMLPDAQGGLILRRIRSSNMNTRVAVITAAGAESLVLKHAAAYNPDAVFLKPLDHNQLREWLDAEAST